MPIKPILFSAPMVTALLEGRKTQTRRILNRLKGYPGLSDFMRSETKGFDWEFRRKDKVWCSFRHEDLLKIMPHVGGDLLYVRENFSRPVINEFIKYNIPPQHWENVALSEYGIHYWADGNPEFGDWENPKPSIHMPRKHSRLTLEVTNVRVELLQDISEEDAKAEGIGEYPCLGPHRGPKATFFSANGRETDLGAALTPRLAFLNLWDSLNKDLGFGWDANPWVSVTEFKVHKCNIDEFEKEAVQ
ncbi:hypothetical protein ACQU0X_23945 [Pseudovibrio ascidiaceicola]|uniref:hypothetical protein n=1 Tax=Pseudovibrio ascidiaceicola TaxID=285279 RepID=UPI003D36036D